MRVLYAEDDIDDVQLVCDAFESIDPEIICDTVPNGREIFTYLNNSSSLPDVIFLDINMPIMNGLTCLHDLKVHPKYKGIPVIMYTTSQKEIEYIDAIAQGATAFVIKPGSFNELINFLKQALAKISL